VMRFFLVALCLWMSPARAAEGDAANGSRAFRACAACHSLEADRHMTGPSLAGVWNRRAGSSATFSRYSEVMKNSRVVWNERTLDGYLENPARFMPGNHMTFAGVPDTKTRADIVAFLKQGAPAQTADTAERSARNRMDGMAGMQRAVPKLKTVDNTSRVRSITYCRDTFKVTTADGQTRDYWERNLRFKTDSSEDGPNRNEPAIVGAGMMGDRASVIFASPEEISQFIARHC
jgi:cytochrome c